MWLESDPYKRLWVRAAVFLVCGYMLYNRNFAYIGIPAAKIFIGDALLALFFIFGMGTMIGPWLTGLIRQTPLSGFSWGLLLFLMYGLFQFARGLALGHSPVLALEELVFNVYPLFFFVGLEAALRYRGLLPKLFKFAAIISCFGSVMYLVAREVGTVPSFISWLEPSAGPFVILGGLTYFDLRRWWPVIVLHVFTTLMSQVRAVWAGLAVAFVVDAIVTRRLKRFAWATASVVALLLMGALIDFRIPSPEGRGGEVSSRELLARAIAPFDPESALELSRKNAGMYAGTVQWRRRWWLEIWRSSQEDLETSLLGHGYGFPLHELVPYLRTAEDLRTPHNIFFFALGYTGWVGAVLFYSLQASLGLILLRVARSTGQTFGIVFWTWMLTGSHFGNGFETPFGAIPYYLLVGMAAAELVGNSAAEESVIDMSSMEPASQGEMLTHGP